MEMESKQKSSLGIASLVLGIISICSALFWYINIPSSILAIVFGSKSIKKVGSGLGKAGFILGIIGFAILAFIYMSLALMIILSNIWR